MARLLAIQGPLKGCSFPLGEAVTIGRDPACSIVLEDETVSRRHAEVAIGKSEKNGASVRDTDSRNGICVNGKKVKEAPLAPGDVLTVGEHRFLLQAEQLPGTTLLAPERSEAAVGFSQSPPELIGQSESFRKCLATARKIATSEAPVLLTGETGTGKELLARWVHDQGERAAGPFIAVNMAAVPETLFEADLFGAEKGAFTGANERRPGKFELAAGGTLFLDEIGDLPPALQPKLLRAVQEKTFFRVGGHREVRADVRILAATNRDLADLTRASKFREDLYHRLSTLVLTIPPLRERPGDVAILAESVARTTARRLGKPFPQLPPEAVRRLEGHGWPGNVRELANVVERAVTLSETDVIGPEAFVFGDTRPAGEVASIGISLERAEREEIRKALERSGWKKGEAARLLGISIPTLRAKIRAYGLEK